jgi:tetratricopeptide (TPR) repeat protein
MQMRGRLVTLVAVVAVARAARAQPTPAAIAQAEQLFEEARSLLENQRYAEACEKFARSFAVGRVIGAELNLGDCAEREGRLAAAWRLFDAAARDWEREGDDDRSGHARASADRVATRLATIVVTLPDPPVVGTTVRIAERELPPAREIRELVEPGEVEIVVTVAGRSPVRRTAHARAGAIATIDIPAIESPAPGASPRRSEPAPSPHSRSLVAPVALAGGAIALAGAALGLWQWSDRTYDKASAAFDNARQGKLFDDANRRYHAAQGLGFASVACAGAAVWLYVRGRNQEPSAIGRTSRLTVAPLLASGRTGLLLEGRY